MKPLVIFDLCLSRSEIPFIRKGGKREKNRKDMKIKIVL